MIKNLPEELLIVKRINRKISLFFFLNILIFTLVIFVIILQNQKTIKLTYNEHTMDLSNPIINITSTHEAIEGIQLYEKNNIIVTMQKTLTLHQGFNPYLKHLAMYYSPRVSRYYKDNIKFKSFRESLGYEIPLESYSRNIQIKKIRELKNRTANVDGKIQKSYELDANIIEYIADEKEKTHSMPAQINLVITYHSKKRIRTLTKNNPEYPIINPLDLNIISLFIVRK